MFNKRIFILIYFIISFYLFSTPDKSYWKRIIFIGANNNYYICFEVERDQPGSHYKFFEKLYIVKYNNQDNLLKRILIKSIEYSDEKASGEWKIKEKTESQIDIQKYLEDNFINFSFDKNYYLKKYDFKIDESGIFYIFKNKKVIIKSLKELMKNNTANYNSSSRIISYYENKKLLHFLIETGSDFYDSDFMQSIITLSEDEIINKLPDKEK